MKVPERRRSLRNGRPPTREQLEALAAVLVYGTSYDAADALGLSESAVRMRLSRLYDRISAQSALNAATMLGWIHIPADLVADLPTTGGHKD